MTGADVNIHPSWKRALAEEFSKPYFKALADFLQIEYGCETVYPPAADIFRALNTTPLDNVKVVILGQDPYHGPGQANGLSFSVAPGIQIPPSLRNIFKEIQSDLNLSPPDSGDLEPWARQGVLLLNATLTVRAHEAGSHQKKGWEEFTDAVIRAVNEECENVVFMLWGSYARKKGAFADREKHLVLESPHPSPLSAHRGFLGNRHFSQANTFLSERDVETIDWRL